MVSTMSHKAVALCLALSVHSTSSLSSHHFLDVVDDDDLPLAPHSQRHRATADHNDDSTPASDAEVIRLFATMVALNVLVGLALLAFANVLQRVLRIKSADPNAIEKVTARQQLVAAPEPPSKPLGCPLLHDVRLVTAV